jgi:heme/copper-type cytochrome/quinol oxidase subunit 2
MRSSPELSPRSPVSPLLWFAVLGAPTAWGLQFAVGYWLSDAQCSATGGQWGIALDTWAIVVGILAFLTATASGATAVALFRRTAEAEEEDAPPSGRIHFLAVVGMAVTPLFLCLIAMTAAGTIVLFPCNQS